jgi:hypothetical protein
MSNQEPMTAGHEPFHSSTKEQNIQATYLQHHGSGKLLPASLVVESFVYGKMNGEVFIDSQTSRQIGEKLIPFKIS